MSDLLAAFDLRRATRNDADVIAAISTGPVANKRAFIVDSIERRFVITACHEERVVGAIIWDRAFFGRPFVWLIGVDPAWRRRGIAVRLLHAFEASCPGEALFISTNESNRAMQALLAGIDFVPSGRVENIDPDDAELFFYKTAVK